MKYVPFVLLFAYWVYLMMALRFGWWIPHSPLRQSRKDDVQRCQNCQARAWKYSYGTGKNRCSSCGAVWPGEVS